MRTRAQAAVEYMVITGMALLILLVLLSTAYQKVAESEKQSDLDAVGRAVNKIKEAADFVYVHGHPSRLVISVYLPPDIDPSRSFISNRTINLALQVGGMSTDVWRGTRGEVGWDVSGSSGIPGTEGYYTLTVESTGPLLGDVIDVHE